MPNELSVNAVPNTAAARQDWSRWSFTALSRGSSKARHFQDEAGGLDEGGHIAGWSRDDATSVAMNGPLVDMPASAAFGVLVHELLERADFTSDRLHEELIAAVESDPRVLYLAVDGSALAAGLMAVTRTPLGGVAGAARLADVPPSDRLAELAFNLSLGSAGRSIHRAAMLDAAIANEPPEIAACFAELAAEWRDTRVSGLLVGSIDALLRIDGRFHVIDYKSNRLHSPGRPARIGDYSHAAMLDSVRQHQYLLQALIYAVATHRFLERRLRGYDPDVHLGGVGYLFVRGMIGPDTPVIDGVTNGVFGWRPALETIIATDLALAGGL